MTYRPPTPCRGTLPDARVAPPDLLDVLGRIRVDLLSGSLTRNALADRVQQVMEDAEDMPLAEDVECGYDGEVDDVHYHRLARLVSWTCPRCGEANEEEAPEPDPDLAYDLARERGER